MYFFLWTHFRLSNWMAMECYSVGGWEWCESLSSWGMNMIKPNDTKKMAIEYESVLATFNIKNFSP